MRRIRHPIALFIIAVIGVIGIGVGVLAASGGAGFVMAPNLTEGPSRTYGPPGLQFVAAFPGTPTCRAAENGATFGCHVGHTAHELFAISVTNTSRLPKDIQDSARAGLSMGESASSSDVRGRRAENCHCCVAVAPRTSASGQTSVRKA